MKVKVRKKPVHAVERTERANVTANIPFLTSDISCYCNHRKKKPVHAVECMERANKAKIIPADDIKEMVYQLHDFLEKTSKIPHMLPDQKDCMLSVFVDRALMRKKP